MSSLHAINRATNSNRGGGLLFYEKIDYIFSNWNNGFNSVNGLWSVPNNKVPTFQIWIPFEFITSFVYHETKGCNDFTGTTFTPASFGGITIEAAQTNGNQDYIYSTDDSGTLITPAPDGRWVAFLTVNNGGGDTTYYSEEFVTKDCC